MSTWPFLAGYARPGKIHDLSVSPNPVVGKTGDTITINLNFTLEETLKKGSKVAVNLTKHVGGKSSKVPCMKHKEHKIGSWWVKSD